MSTVVTARNACAGSGAFYYQRHRPEKTLLYQLVSRHYPVFRQQLAEEDRILPGYVQRKFKDYLKCGRLEHGFLRVRCETCHKERLVAFSCKCRGFCPSCGARRMAESAALLPDDFADTAGRISGFSLHAGVAARADERKKLERLCRYISRPAVSEKRLSLTSNGNIRYQLKTPYRDGTIHVIFEPLDFMARLAALVPKPRVNLTRFHGVFVRGGHPPNSKHRAVVTPAKRCKGNKRQENSKTDDGMPTKHHTAMTWAKRLKRAFNIDITICEERGGDVKVIADTSDRSIEDPVVIKQIRAHLQRKSESKQFNPLPESRAPPQKSLFEQPTRSV